MLREATKVVGINVETRLRVEYPSINSVSIDGFSPCAVCRCCKSERISHKGFIWRYKHDKDRIEKINKILDKKVICVTTGEIYPNLHVASLKTGFNSGNISACVEGKRRSTCNTVWRYYSEYIEENKNIS